MSYLSIVLVVMVLHYETTLRYGYRNHVNILFPFPYPKRGRTLAPATSRLHIPSADLVRSRRHILQPNACRALSLLDIQLISTHNDLLMQDLLHVRTTLSLLDGTEQDIHVLKLEALGLLDEEEDEGAHAEAEDAEHDEGAVADVVHGAGRDLGDAEVEEPLGGGAHADAVGAQPRGEDLGEVDPGDGAPGGRVPDHVQVDHDDHGDGGGRHDVDVGGRVRVQHGGEDEHHGHHPGGAGDEGLAPAQLVDADEEEDGRGGDLDGAVDARGEQRRVGLGHADGLEDLGRVVANAVGARELLPEHDAEAVDEAPAVARREALAPAHALRLRQLLLDGRLDLRDLLHDLGVRGGLAAHVGQRGGGLFDAAAGDEPARGLLQEPQADEQEAAGDELDGDRDAPLLGGLGDVQRDAVVQPVRKGRADDQELLEEAGDAPAHARRAVLRHEDGRDAAHAADAQARDDPPAIDLPDGVLGADLDGRAHEEHQREAHQREPSPEAFVQEGRPDGPEEAARRQERHHVRRHLRVVRVGEA